MSDYIVLNCGYELDINVLYTNKIKKIKKYVNIFVFHISNKNPKKFKNDVNFFSKNNFLIINLNCIIIIYKLYILIF